MDFSSLLINNKFVQQKYSIQEDEIKELKNVFNKVRVKIIEIMRFNCNNCIQNLKF